MASDASDDSKARLEQILSGLERLVGSKLDLRLPVSPEGDELDALAYGINALAQEAVYGSVSKELLQGVIDAIADVLLVVRADGRVMRTNRAGVALLGGVPERFRGIPLAELAADGAVASRLFALLREKAELRDVELSVLTSEGDVVPLVWNGQRVSGAESECYVLVGRDLRLLRAALAKAATAEVEARRAADLERARRALEEANRAKSQFLTSMSHEFRTPMTTILATAELMARGDVPQEVLAQRFLRIKRSGMQLLGIIEDLLEFSLLEAGAATLQLGPCELAELVAAPVRAFSERASEKGLKLKLHLAPRLPLRVETDAARVRQIASCVLSNAIKFTQEGSIEVLVAWQPQSAEQGTLRLEVSDTGVGIDEELHTDLFEPFVQATPGKVPGGGTGVGLAIARRLARCLGGDVRLVRSVPGQGSTFEAAIAARLVHG